MFDNGTPGRITDAAADADGGPVQRARGSRWPTP